MPDKGRRHDSSLHGFPAPPQTTPREAILPPGAEGVPDGLHERLVVLYGRFIHQFFKTVLGLRGDDLKDATQDFFVHLLEKEAFRRLRSRDSFRGFLRLACRRFYLNRLEAAKARRRDVRRNVSLDGDAPPPMTEDRFFEAFDREERRRYLEMAVEAARDEIRRLGQEELFELLREHVGDEGRAPQSYAALAAKHGCSESDVRNRLAKVRRILRDALLRLAAQRSKDPEGELRELGLHAFASPPKA